MPGDAKEDQGSKSKSSLKKAEKGSDKKGIKSSEPAPSADPAQTPPPSQGDLEKFITAMTGSISAGFAGLSAKLDEGFANLTYADQYEDYTDSEAMETSFDTPNPATAAPLPLDLAHGGPDGTQMGPKSIKTRFLENLGEQVKPKEVSGPAIDESLANNISFLMRNKQDDRSMSEFLDSIATPENCPGLSKITVNQQIWDRVPPSARSIDIKLSRVQMALTKGTACVAYMANALAGSFDESTSTIDSSKVNDILDMSAKAFKCLGQANMELVVRRRECIKPHISASYSHLCSPSLPVSDLLFGDDVTKKIKDITDDNRVHNHAVFGRQTGPPPRRGRRQPAFRSRGRPFLGARGPQYGNAGTRSSGGSPTRHRRSGSRPQPKPESKQQ